MQIDFHHGVTYVVARLAGLSKQDAEVVAYCAQYVDDATNSGTIKFKNGAMYKRMSSAHKLLDIRNFDELSNHRTWIPFHFLPGNDGLPAGQDPTPDEFGMFYKKLICKPNSPVAQDMVVECIKRKDLPYSLHLLGVTSHVFIDTWAHQEFAGIEHAVNKIRSIDDGPEHSDGSWWDKFKEKAKDVFEKAISMILSERFPLGHGAALSFPDLPYLKWSYTNELGRPITRDNPLAFLEAADELHKVISRYIDGDSSKPGVGLSDPDKSTIQKMIRDLAIMDGEERHKHWLEAIARGDFSFGAEQVSYKGKGSGSWKHQVLGTEKEIDLGTECFPYNPAFLTSNWKYFHDAIILHRHYMVHDVLPRYGICVS